MITDLDDATYRLHQEQNKAVTQLQNDLTILALANAARALLAAVDYRCNGADRDVRVRDLWGAAYALKRIEQELQEH